MKTDFPALPPETEKVWAFLSEQPALAGFVLIGGSALALRIHHRRSEDLDLVWLENRLPLVHMEATRPAAEAAGYKFREDEDEAAAQQFVDAGLELRHYQQNFLVQESVRISFFVADAPLCKVLTNPPEGRIRVGTLQELFKAKSLVSARRSKTRDWVDLYLLFQNHGFTARDFLDAFREAGIESQCSIALGRLCSGIPQKDDEGYEHLLANPPSLQEMRRFFVSQRDQLEMDMAAKAMRERKSSNRS